MSYPGQLFPLQIHYVHQHYLVSTRTFRSSWLAPAFFLPFDLIKAGETQPKMPSLKQLGTGEQVYLPDENFSFCLWSVPVATLGSKTPKDVALRYIARKQIKKKKKKNYQKILSWFYNHFGFKNSPFNFIHSFLFIRERERERERETSLFLSDTGESQNARK